MKPRLGFYLFLLFSGSTSIMALTVDLDVRSSVIELKPGLKTEVWSYSGTVPGPAIVANVGDELTVNVKNDLSVPTSVHWHGLEVPNDQDGTMSSIPPGSSFTYRFKLTTAGTYWYHSHTRPVLEQVDRGLYGALIVKAPEDQKYSSDQTLVLDDWYLDANGKRLAGTARGGMERLGNVETVNGKTAGAIVPINVSQGELHKFRFINASSAAVQNVKLSRGTFRVTHTDGHPLTEPYQTEALELQPGERFDVEYSADGKPGSQDFIESTDRDLGLRLPIVYGAAVKAPVSSPFVPPPSRAFTGIADKKPDYVLTLNSRMSGMGNSMKMDGMDMGDGMSMNGGMMMDHGSMGSMVEWTINGKAFPDTDILKAKVGQVVKIRFVNKDTAMMHPMDHPMHLHGTFFQVVSINGKAPEQELWKDTIAVPAGGWVEVAFVYKNPGDWMLHCHVLDHEDGGLMTIVRVKA